MRIDLPRTCGKHLISMICLTPIFIVILDVIFKVIRNIKHKTASLKIQKLYLLIIGREKIEITD